VIANERQYRITKAWLRRFEEAVGNYTPSKGVDPQMKEVMDAAHQSQAETLRDEIRHYEHLREGRFKERELESLRDLPTAIIEARIASGLTQKELADRLGLHAQQIQRWEANLYSGVGLERLQEVIDATGMYLRETVAYRAAA
jgi:ribosome-binding protein aMBF1 (putative translation factor)